MIDPIHTPDCDPDVAWSCGNVAEAFPGVSTPLSWTYFFESTESACRAAFHDLGLLARQETGVPPRVEERSMGIFYGRAASNVDTLRRLAERTPGVSPDDIVAQTLGTVRAAGQSRPTRHRYPAIAVRMPFAIARAPGRIDRLRPDTDRWWRRSVAALVHAGADEARRLLQEARDRHFALMRAHTVISMLGMGVFDYIARLGARLGEAGLGLQALGGFGDVEETRMAGRMWDVARGGASLEAFVADFGFHGPVEGQLSERTWREDRNPLEALLLKFASLDPAQSPERIRERELDRGGRARRRLLASLPVRARPGARVALALAARLVPRRELGKAGYLQAADVARAAARCLGEDLAARGVLRQPEDVFFLTFHELLGAAPPDALEQVAFRRGRYDGYRRYRLPPAWTGVPEPEAIAPTASASASSSELRGHPASGGTVRGRARVVSDPTTAKLEPGEILVCETTDPSWVPLFVIAGGVVIDIGTGMSHGAIVARELGLPAVVDTGDGTRRLRTGDLIEVDGDAGIVRRMEPAPSHETRRSRV